MIENDIIIINEVFPDQQVVEQRNQRTEPYPILAQGLYHFVEEYRQQIGEPIATEVKIKFKFKNIYIKEKKIKIIY